MCTGCAPDVQRMCTGCAPDVQQAACQMRYDTRQAAAHAFLRIQLSSTILELLIYGPPLGSIPTLHPFPSCLPALHAHAQKVVSFITETLQTAFKLPKYRHACDGGQSESRSTDRSLVMEVNPSRDLLTCRAAAAPCVVASDAVAFGLAGAQVSS